MAFNRIIWGRGWPEAPQGVVDYPADRGPQNQEKVGNGRSEYSTLAALPTLFMAEGQDADDVARVGTVQVRGTGPSTLSLWYQYDLSVPPIPQDRLHAVAAELGLSTTGRHFDWTRTQWSVEEGDLYRALFRLNTSIGNVPELFKINSPPKMDALQVSAMMPFGANFSGVYQAIESAAVAAGMKCNRADNIWEDNTVIQDVVSLIDRSRIVVCDLSGRNPQCFL